MQLLLLKYREEIIASKVAKEHTEETLRSEIMFLKDQVVSEQQEKNNIEETLTQDINTLQEKLGTSYQLNYPNSPLSGAGSIWELKYRSFAVFQLT